MIVVHDYRGYGGHIEAVAAGEGRWNAVVKVRRHFPLEERVTDCHIPLHPRVATAARTAAFDIGPPAFTVAKA